MNAAGPAAGTSDSFGQFRTSSLDATFSSLDKFGAFNPADPLVARERRDVVPGVESRRISRERLAQIGWQGVNRAARYVRVVHSVIVQQTPDSFRHNN